ncbi:A24 family peptidase [Rhodanobacter sp. Col0626]|uniref:A24 family peptidase n=1 Tax=Rhodanobacter sp. Col0626 TaxID=3415679 RepID=UPI003CEF0C74
MQLPLHVLVIAICVLTMAGDFWERKVRNNWLVGALIFGAGWMVWCWARGIAGPPWPAMLGLLMGLVVLLPFYILRSMGAGDVKLFAVLGFLMGAKALLPIWIIASLIAGAHTVLLIMSRMSICLAVVNVLKIQAEKSSLWQRVLTARQGRRGLPYAAYMGIGALVTLYVPNLVHW